MDNKKSQMNTGSMRKLDALENPPFNNSSTTIHPALIVPNRGTIPRHTADRGFDNKQCVRLIILLNFGLLLLTARLIIPAIIAPVNNNPNINTRVREKPNSQAFLGSPGMTNITRNTNALSSAAARQNHFICNNEVEVEFF